MQGCIWICLLNIGLKYPPFVHGGNVIDASETGFLIYSTEPIPVGTKLKVAVLPLRNTSWHFLKCLRKSFGKRLWRNRRRGINMG